MSEAKRLNLKNVVIFKYFFTKEGNEKYLIDFLEALLETKIKDIDVCRDLNLEDIKDRKIYAQATFDDGVIADIEMQILNTEDDEERGTLYLSEKMRKEIQKKTGNRKFISINILGYNVFEDTDEYIHEISISLNDQEKNMMNNIRCMIIELPKFRKSHKNIEELFNNN